MQDDQKRGIATFIGLGIFIIGFILWLITAILGLDQYSDLVVTLYCASAICSTLYYLLKK